VANASQRCIASGVNSACGWLPPMMNIRRCSLPGSSYVTFMKRRATPTGNEITSYGSRSTCSIASPSFHSQRQRPVSAMNVSLVSWLCMSGPLPGFALQ
jgi:hypothetical protein